MKNFIKLLFIVNLHIQELVIIELFLIFLYLFFDVNYITFSKFLKNLAEIDKISIQLISVP